MVRRNRSASFTVTTIAVALAAMAPACRRSTNAQAHAASAGATAATARQGTMRVTITGAESIAQIGNLRPAANNTFVIVRAAIRNEGTTPATSPFRTPQPQLRDAQNRNYEPALEASLTVAAAEQPEGPMTRPLAPSQEFRDVGVFEVPTASLSALRVALLEDTGTSAAGRELVVQPITTRPATRTYPPLPAMPAPAPTPAPAPATTDSDAAPAHNSDEHQGAGDDADGGHEEGSAEQPQQ